MPADQSLRERIEDQRDRVIDALEDKDHRKQDRDRAERLLEHAIEATKRAEQNLKDAKRDGSDRRVKRAKARIAEKQEAQREARDEGKLRDRKLTEAQKRLDGVRDRLMELKDERDERRERQREKFSTAPGSPTWGGAELIIQREVEPEIEQHRPNATRTSGKRTATFGNPGSDHHTSQTRSSAGDWNLVNDQEMRNIVSRKLAGRNSADYEAVFFEYEGHEFRLQGIAQTHGTGPHLHEGLELVG